jgi:hypothetical protein
MSTAHMKVCWRHLKRIWKDVLSEGISNDLETFKRLAALLRPHINAACAGVLNLGDLVEEAPSSA